MEKDITKFVGRKSHEQNLISRFTKMVKSANTKKEIRELEMRLLRPKPIEQYKGPRPGRSNYKQKVITVTFPNRKYVDQWAKYFKVNTYVENNTYDIDFLIELFRLMEIGYISWDPKKKSFTFNHKKNKRKIRRRVK